MSRFKSVRCALLLVVFAFCVLAQKRALTHADYDTWRHIQNQHLSDDGKYLAYAEFPQEGDGLVIVRNLTTGKEIREDAGQLPPPPPPNYSEPVAEPGPPATRNVILTFTRDGRTLVFSTFPTKAEVDQAKQDKKKPQPKAGLRILDVGSGTAVRLAGVKSFQVPAKGDGYVAYLHEPEDGAKKDAGGQLVLRNLSANTERTFSDVTEYTLTKDARLLTFAVTSKDDAGNGVYAVTPGNESAPKVLIAGAGKFSKLAWDERQDELAFFGGKESKLYLWPRETSAATEIVGPATAGLPAGSIVSEKSAITFSKTGQRIFFGYAPRPTPPSVDKILSQDRPSVDLWHWKDDYIQPMQKVRAQADRTRSFRAVYSVPEKRLTVLADRTMSEVTPSDDGRYSLGGDDREYRTMVEYDDRYVDSYLVDNQTGERKLVAKKHIGRVTWSPGAKYALFFNGRDWITVSVPEGKTTNLTSSLGVRFWSEEHDSPGSPQPYGLAGWTQDGRSVLVNDHYDIWRIAPDGNSAKNITQTGRKQRLMFRYVKLENDPEDRWIDLAKPMLLRAEHVDLRDSGFYLLKGDAVPQKLIMAPRNFSNPIKARNADVVVLTASTFRESPDLHVTDSTFRELRKVSDANPQQAGFLWGSAELVHYRSLDGTPLSGILYKPDNFDSKKKYPLLVYIYERLTQGLNSYVEPRPSHNINVSYYVSNGYLVLEPDIAYKIGYPGQSALQCVLPAVQAVVDQGMVDENAIGIQGHSWGGYQIAYMITQTTRFKAVAAGAPVANMTSAYDGIRWGPGLPRQFQYERTQSRIGGSLWEYPMRYIENSPVFMADRVKTPIMMIHNDADDAVPWYQGIEYYLALRRLGKEVYLFTYNGEPHGLRRRPNQKDYTVRLQQYFDYYLKGAPKPDWMAHGIPYLQKPGIVTETDQ